MTAVMYAETFFGVRIRPRSLYSRVRFVSLVKGDLSVRGVVKNCVEQFGKCLSFFWLDCERRKMLLLLVAKRSPRRRRLDPVFVFAKGFGLIEGGQPVFFRAAARKKGSKRGRRTLFGDEVLYNVSSLAGL